MSACQKCGYQCADEEKYCSKCGCQLTNTVNPMKKTKQSKTMIFYKLLLGYGIFMILIIIGSISWSENNKKGIASLLFHLALVIISIFLIKKTKSKSTNVIQDKTQNDRDITSSQSIYDDSVPTNQVDPKYAKFIKQRLALYKFLFGFGIFMILMGYAGISGAWEEKGIAIFAIISGLACMCLAIILISITKSKSINVAVYKPKKGFYFYRISTEQRIKFYKRLRIFLSIILLSAAGFLYIKKIWGKEVLNVNFFRNVSDVVGYVFFAFVSFGCFTWLIKRLKFSDPLDDASYFELEELKLISEKDIIISLYKDFSSWEDVEENSKLLILTQDNLILLNFLTRNTAKKILFPLSKLDKLGLLRVGDAMEGYILTIGFKDNYIRIILSGSSYQDSPEEFLALFLREIDNRLLNKPINIGRETRKSAPVSSQSIDNIRKIDIEDKTIDTINSTSISDSRVIEF